jgi:HK97 family phage major capsid protein
MDLLKQLRAKRDELLTNIEALMQGEDFDPADATLVEARSEVEKIDSRIKALVDFSQSRNAANKVDALSIGSAEVRENESNPPLSLGTLWTRSKAYSDYMQAPKGNSAPVSMPFDALQTRAVITTVGVNATKEIVEKQRIGSPDRGSILTPLLDIVGKVQVSTGSVEWVVWGADPVAGGPIAEGDAKPEATFSPDLKTINLEVLAHWIQYSRQFAEDAQALLQYMDDALVRGVLLKREARIGAALIAGGSGIPTTTNTDGLLIEGIRVAIADVQLAGFAPQAVALNPADYAALDIGVMNSTLRGPVVNGQFWSVTPVPVAAVASGTAYVGDFQTGVVELSRNSVQTYTTDSDIIDGQTVKSAFRSNVLTTLVEGRTNVVVHQPQALRKVTGLLKPEAA